MGIAVETFNAAGDVVFAETFISEGGALRTARLAFQLNNGVSINGVDCFNWSEAERAMRSTRLAQTEIAA